MIFSFLRRCDHLHLDVADAACAVVHMRKGGLAARGVESGAARSGVMEAGRQERPEGCRSSSIPKREADNDSDRTLFERVLVAALVRDSS